MSRGPITTTLTHGDHYRKNDYWMIDDLTGQKMRQSDARKTWEGYWVHKDHWEAKHPQLSVKGVKDKQSVSPVRPRPPEVFIGVNLLLQSETFDNASWAKTNSTIIADSVLSSEGSSTADSLVDDITNGAHNIEQSTSSLSPQASLTVSVEALRGSQNFLLIKVYETGTEANSISVWFNLIAGTVTATLTSGTASSVTGKIERKTILGDIWFRCTVTGVPSTSGSATTAALQAVTASLGTTYIGDSSTAIFLWGVYAKSGDPGAYIVTTTATVSNERVDL